MSDCKMFNKQCVIKEFESDKEKEKGELVNLMELVIEENREALEKLGS